MAFCEVCLGTGLHWARHSTGSLVPSSQARGCSLAWPSRSGDWRWSLGLEETTLIRLSAQPRPGLPEFSFEVWGQPLANKTLLVIIIRTYLHW